MTIKAVKILLPLIGFVCQANPAGLTAKITLPDGATRVAKVEGIGCSVAICSRVAIKGGTQGDSLVQKSLRSIAAIKDTNHGHALLVLKNGTEARVSLIRDFRVLYLANPAGGDDKLDLANVKSVEFVSSAK